MKKILMIGGLVLAIFVLVGAGGKYDYLLEMGDKTPPPTECNKCHTTMYEEWSKSFHAKAYTNDQFKKASNSYARQECLACHAAQQIAAEKDLTLRPVYKENGVICATCHLRNNMIYGPYKVVSKHLTEQDEAMVKSAFCAGCHQPTFQEWQASGSQKQCQDCHMPRVERKLVQVFPISSFVPKRMAGQHLQMFNGVCQGVAALAGQKDAGSVSVTVTNNGAGHNMPTGKYGDYRMVLTTKAVDAGGKEVLSKEEVFATQKGTGVPFKKAMKYDYPLPAGVGANYKVKATLVYKASGRPDVAIASWNAE
jgi:hypothetical protein